ncbi:putative toxin-antitoxin system toxin component, PIN family [Candidatus Aerophobetes bacterium]|uniref:Putative toxin-antitoxin system toxin component, PIN family n=1 Tax=Aerophobetes bacterium TaxID=2030807 RepID=A0A497E2F9_UNCAE|nr:MAG: putative toxin-antitoxin system toxin component, PIN family [Candidatus Aerophobetes bacterium]
MNIGKKNPVKVVVDTNVYISAILFGGNPEKIRRLSKEGRVELLISEAIIAEVAEVLRRKFNWENWQISQTIDEIREIATLVIPRQTLFIIKKDDNDNRILECAVEGKAQYIVSGDKHHLLPLKEYQGIRILTPAQFLEAISLEPD